MLSSTHRLIAWYNQHHCIPARMEHHSIGASHPWWSQSAVLVPNLQFLWSLRIYSSGCGTFVALWAKDQRWRSPGCKDRWDMKSAIRWVHKHWVHQTIHNHPKQIQQFNTTTIFAGKLSIYGRTSHGNQNRLKSCKEEWSWSTMIN